MKKYSTALFQSPVPAKLASLDRPPFDHPMNHFAAKSSPTLPRWAKAINLVTACAVTALQLAPLTALRASDHIDAPTMTQDRGADIADMWAFLDPNDNSQMVLILSTQAFVVSGEHFGMGIFDPNLRYRFEIENTGDAVPDLFVDVTYSAGVGRLTAQTATITLSSGADRNRLPVSLKRPSGAAAPRFSFTALTTISNQEPRPALPPQPVITSDSASGMMFYGGVADDPFFLDDTGANRFVASSIMRPGNPDKTLLGARGGRDTYAGFNTMITAVRVPVALLRGTVGVIGVNSVTERRETQSIDRNTNYTGSGAWVAVDRSGTPLVNNGLIPAARKNEFNGASTADDAAGRFRADIIQSLRNLGTTQPFIDMILAGSVNNGDIVRVDLSVPNTGPGGGDNANGGYGKMGGRRLKDDVVDGTFTLINNGVPMTDFVNANDVPLRNVFPFVADPTQPFPAGAGAEDFTRQ